MYFVYVLIMFCVHCAAKDEKLVPLRATCKSSVQCVGVSVCVDHICRCPPSYTAIGNTCVHSGFENGLGSEQLQLFSSERYSSSSGQDKENRENFQNGDAVRIGSSLLSDQHPLSILSKIVPSAATISSSGYPGQACGGQNECRGNSFCYKGVCSCHAGAIVSGRICAVVTSNSKSTKSLSSTSAPMSRTKTTITRTTTKPTTALPRAPLGVELICPPPMFWADGTCLAPVVTVPSVSDNNSIMPPTLIPDADAMSGAPPSGICRPPLVIVDGWCVLPGTIPAPYLVENTKSILSSVTPMPQSRCPSSSIWFEGRCVTPRLPNIQPTPFLTPLTPQQPSAASIDIGQPIMIGQSSSPTRRCPPGEILINAACLSTAVVVNYPSPLLCRSGSDCPGGSTCLSNFCVCPAPFVWHPKLGCDSPSLSASAAVDQLNSESMTVRNFLPNSPTNNNNNFRQTANGFVQLGGRCRQDNDCVERSVCELGTCACRAPFVPYSTTCIFAPTEEEVVLVVQ